MAHALLLLGRLAGRLPPAAALQQLRPLSTAAADPPKPVQAVAKSRAQKETLFAALASEKKEAMVDPTTTYRFGFTEAELATVPENIKAAFRLSAGKLQEKLSAQIAQAMAPWKRHVLDTGSSEAQVVSLTQRIQSLAQHCQQNRKDHRASRDIQIYLNRRQSMLKYLYRTHPETYFKLLAELSLSPVHNFRGAQTRNDPATIKEIKAKEERRAKKREQKKARNKKARATK
eukprot:TRINITY_DN15346_c0_g1_i1.p1 TRINITY_DN15346_c0_g1~~TRINITY_DN15346_c0_g1_i1.p1  ORF type:complete len:239 (-),score=64.92 TRINITY_DN15346_c0_g1_i1:15-707(-)